LFGPTGREFPAELSLSKADRTIVEAHFSVIEELTEQIEEVEDLIEIKVLEHSEMQLLLLIPGVGNFTSAVIVAELGEIDRFDCHEEAVSYAGLDPTVHQSGETEVRGSISKEDPAVLRWALIQAATNAVRYDEYLGNFYTRLKERKNHKIAIVATARKLLVSVFYMLTREEIYNPPKERA